MTKFEQRVDAAVEALSANTNKNVDENDFIDASRLVYDGVREIRRAVLMNRVRIHKFEFYVCVKICGLPLYILICGIKYT